MQILPAQIGVGSAHGTPQPPQLFGSLDVSTHAVGLMVGQAVKPIIVQVPPQFVPSHVAVPLVGVGQAVHSGPQEPGSVLLVQVLPQVFAGQTHIELWHVFGLVHTLPGAQPPQWFESLVVLISQPFETTVSQSAKPVLHDPMVQLVPLHPDVPLAGVGQAAHIAPHEVGSVLLTHVPLQS